MVPSAHMLLILPTAPYLLQSLFAQLHQPQASVISLTETINPLPEQHQFSSHLPSEAADPTI